MLVKIYWENNFNKFKKQNPNLSKYIEQNKFNSKLLTEVMIINEVVKLHKVNKILNNIDSSFEINNLNSINDNLHKLITVVPDSVRSMEISKDYINKTNTLINKVDNKYVHKSDSFIKRFISYITNIDISTVLKFYILCIGLYYLLKYLIDHDKKIFFIGKDLLEKFRKYIKYAIVFGSVYLLYRMIVHIFHKSNNE